MLIKDEFGNPVTNAEAVFTNQNSTAQYDLFPSSDHGYYYAVAYESGTYDLQIHAPGFQNKETKDIEVVRESCGLVAPAPYQEVTLQR